jgi:RNA polymerase sigma-70 factor (ECF subfamily)
MVSAAPLSPDARVIAQAASGDEAAFDALVGPLLDPAYRLAVVMLRDREEARDAVQEACFMAWRNLARLRTQDSFGSWFLTIVANRCRSVARTRWWKTLRLPLAAPEHDLDHSTVESDVDIRRELDRLPAGERAALYLFFYMDLPLKEVAKVLKVSPQAAKSRVHRAVTKLRLNMQEVSL